MPLVHVYWNEDMIDQEEVWPIVCALPGIVSSAFDHNGLSGFSPDEVTVRPFRCEMTEPGPPVPNRTPMSHDLEVFVWADHSQNREAARGEIVERMRDGLREVVMDGCSGFVWLLLQPTAFADFSSGSKPVASS